MADPVARGIAAQQLLDNETFQDLLTSVEAEAVEALASADIADPASLIRATADLQAVRRVRDHARSLAATGLLKGRSRPVVA